MATPRSPTLRNLYNLNAASHGFQDQLVNLLDDEEYVRCIPNLGETDLVWLMDYLGEVGHIAATTLSFAQAKVDPQSSRPP